jgi:hypothetical protein
MQYRPVLVSATEDWKFVSRDVNAAKVELYRFLKNNFIK